MEGKVPTMENEEQMEIGVDVPVVPVKNGKRRRAEATSDTSPTDPPSKAARTALGRSKKPEINGGSSQDAEVKSKAKPLARTASRKGKQEVAATPIGEVIIGDEGSEVKSKVKLARTASSRKKKPEPEPEPVAAATDQVDGLIISNEEEAKSKGKPVGRTASRKMKKEVQEPVPSAPVEDVIMEEVEEKPKVKLGRTASSRKIKKEAPAAAAPADDVIMEEVEVKPKGKLGRTASSRRTKKEVQAEPPASATDEVTSSQEPERKTKKLGRTMSVKKLKQEPESATSQSQPTDATSENEEADVKPKVKPLARTASVRKPKEVPIAATLYTFGTNDCGQLGFECEKRKYPSLVPTLSTKKIKAIACGGMHTIVLEENGTVWSFGVNDDKALGRRTEEEEDGFEPGEVGVGFLPKNIIQISAGDSHSAALTEDGEVFAWGCFKDQNGNFGLVAEDGDVCRENPECITPRLYGKIVKIASGSNHIAMLSEDGFLYTCGAGEQGQLGRKEASQQRIRVTRSMGANVTGSPKSKKEFLLKPALVRVGRNTKIEDVWTGEYSTYCSSKRTHDLYVFGLNNYSQLGIQPNDESVTDVIEVPTKNTAFAGRKWKQLAAGLHHAVALDNDGIVYTLGRASDGRLGQGSSDQERFTSPTRVEGLADKKCIQVAAGGSTSYAITEDGHLYSWGFGENYQLATGDDEDRNVPFPVVKKVDAKTVVDLDGKVIKITAGGQHCVTTILNKTDPIVTNGSAK